MMAMILKEGKMQLKFTFSCKFKSSSKISTTEPELLQFHILTTLFTKIHIIILPSFLEFLLSNCFLRCFLTRILNTSTFPVSLITVSPTYPALCNLPDIMTTYNVEQYKLQGSSCSVLH